MVNVFAKIAEAAAKTMEKLSGASSGVKENVANLDKPLNSETKDVAEKKENTSRVNVMQNLDAPLNRSNIEYKPIHRCPEENGHWDGVRGNSNWYPDRNYVPPEKSKNPIESPYSNPYNLNWGQILDKYGIKNIPFKDGFPDFSDVAKETVKIEGFETGGNTAKAHNFGKADKELAEKKGCSPGEIEDWRKENNYTWHECEDKRTMQLVPNEVHANIPHDGGRSMID